MMMMVVVVGWFRQMCKMMMVMMIVIDYDDDDGSDDYDDDEIIIRYLKQKGHMHTSKTHSSKSAQLEAMSSVVATHRNAGAEHYGTGKTIHHKCKGIRTKLRSQTVDWGVSYILALWR